MDEDESNRSSQDMQDIEIGSSHHDERDRSNRSFSFYQNYTEIVCATTESKKVTRSSHANELIKQRPEESLIKANSTKWAKVFGLNPQTVLSVTIQGKIIEISVRYLWNRIGFKQYEAESFSQKNSWAPKYQANTKRYDNHSSELLHEVVLQRVDEGNNLEDSPNYCLYYCGKDLSSVYWLKFSVFDLELRAEESKIGINTEHQSATTFSVTYDYTNDRNYFLFGSQEVEGVLVSGSTTFGRKPTGNERLELTHTSGQGGILKNKIGSLLKNMSKRLTRQERSQTHCIKLQ